MALPAKASIAVEIACDSVAGAQTAAATGATRLELCQCLEQGGLTPSLGLLQSVKAAVRIPVFVMIRPRPGDFLYDDGEFDAMRRDVAHARAAGADGIVCGMLLPSGAIDRERFREVRAAAGPLPITCHRAFDLSVDALAAIDALVELGVQRILTSGQAANATAGIATLRACVQHAKGRLIVMAGAGIHDGNVRELVAASGVREVHLSATAWTGSAMSFRRPGVPMAATPPIDEYVQRSTDGALVARVVAALRNA